MTAKSGADLKTYIRNSCVANLLIAKVLSDMGNVASIKVLDEDLKKVSFGVVYKTFREALKS